MAGEDPEIIEIKTGHDVGLLFDQNGLVTKIITNNFRNYPEAQLINVQRVDLIHDLIIEGYIQNEDDEEEELKRYSVHPKAHLVYNRQETQIAPYDCQFGSKTIGQRAATIFARP